VHCGVWERLGECCSVGVNKEAGEKGEGDGVDGEGQSRIQDLV
jgi:hypothetical protein